MLLKYLKTPFEKENINLQKDDYYTYINEKWFEHLKIDKRLKYLTKIDDFRVVQFNVYNQIEEIIKDYIATHSNTRLGIELKHFYISANNFNTQTNTKKYINEVVSYIDKLRENKDNLWEMLAFLNKNEMTNDVSPFSWAYSPDKKNSKKYCNYLNPRTFAFFDLNAYVTDNDHQPYTKKYKKNFFIYMHKLFKFIGDSSLVPENVFNVEQAMLKTILTSDDSIKEDPLFYNKVTAEEAFEKYGFNWTEYSKHMGFKSTPEYLITTSLTYLKSCTQLLIDNWNSEEWRSYWIWVVARYKIRLTQNIRNIYFEFYGKVSQGMEQIVPQKLLSIIFTAFAFNSLIHNEYIDRNYVERDVVYCENMANNIREIFKNIITRNKWMQPRTRKYAIFKLNRLNINIRPNKINNPDPLLNYNQNDFLGNIYKLLEWRHNAFVNDDIDIIKNLLLLDFGQYPISIISRPSYLVNAQYIPDENAMYIPLAYIQKPFLDLDERGIEYNLSYMGFTIAHELSHGLDDLGSKYDYKGELNEWWSNKDKQKYKQIQDDIIKHYEKFAEYDGIDFDASPTIGEDIADISGLTICEDYLRNVHIKDKNIQIINRQSYSDFYIYFTYQMKQNIKRKSIKYEMIKNPHPLDKYRANVPLSRSVIFRSLHNIQKRDKMYWNNETGIW
jgi:predicted metalloendopeptidase